MNSQEIAGLQTQWKKRFDNGHIIPVMPAFTEDGSPDYESTEAFVRWQMGEGSRIFWTTPGTSCFWNLCDAEILELNKRIAAITHGKAIFIASSNWMWPVRARRQFISEMADAGADVVKLPIHWDTLYQRVWRGVSEDDIVEFHEAIACETPLPLITYTLGAPGVTDSLLRRIAGIPAYIGMKNDTDDYYRQRDYLRLLKECAPCFQPITGGWMESHLSNLPYGDGLYTAASGMIAPDKPREFDSLIRQGDISAATKVVTGWEQSLTRGAIACFENSHWAFIRQALYLIGIFKTPYAPFPHKKPTENQLAYVRDYIEQDGKL